MAPGAGTLKEVEQLNFTHLNDTVAQDYRLIIDYGCGVSTIYIHVSKLADAVAAAETITPGRSKAVQVPVAAGQVLGSLDPLSPETHQLDFSVVDTKVNGLGQPEQLC